MQDKKPSMYKIYSRNRIEIFKNRNHKKNISIFILLIIIIIAISFYVVMWKSVGPIFDNICEDEAKAIATKITNDESTKALESYNYDDLYKIERDDLRKYTNDKRKYISNR